MAGVKGQPTPTPKDLNSPVPETGADPFADLSDPFADLAAAPDEGQPQGYTGFGADALQTFADWAPTIGAVTGGLVGIPGAPLTAGASAVVGAGAGAVGGNSVRRLIEVDILGKKPMPLADELYQGAYEGAKESLGQMFGLGVAKVGKAAAATKMGSKTIDYLADLAAKPISYVQAGIREAYDELAQPVLKMIEAKRTPLNTEQAGDTVKGILQNDINQRFGKFQAANQAINNVAKAIPLADEPRAQFYDKAYNWSLKTLGLDNQKLVGRWLNRLIESNSLAQFESVKKEIGRAAVEAAETYGEKSSQAMALRNIQRRADDFVEGQVTNLAERIGQGKASMSEMNAFQQMMGMQPNPSVPVGNNNLTAYTKSVAKDYLEGKDAVKKFYGKFRSFLEDVGEHVGIDPGGRGAKNFVQSIQDVPSEKLIERMFDPKNARALRAMKTEMPEVFDVVTRSKMSEMVRAASPTGDIDLGLLQKALNRMPVPSRDVLLEGVGKIDEINATLNSPKFKALEALEKKTAKSILDTIYQASQIVGITGGKIMREAPAALEKSPVALQAVSQTVGAPLVAAPLAEVFALGYQGGHE